MPPQPEFTNTAIQLAALTNKAKSLNNEVQQKIVLEKKLLKQLKVAGANESKAYESKKEVLTSASELKKEVKRVRHERNLLGQQINLGRTEMAALQASLRESANAGTKVIRYHQDMSKSLLDEIGEQKEFIKFQSKRLVSLKKQIEASNTTKAANTAALTSQLAEGERELALLRQGLHEASTELKATQSKLKQVTSERNKARQDLHKMTESRDMWRATAAAALGANIKLTASNQELREALHAKRQETKQLDDDLAKAKERCKSLACGALSLDAIDRKLNENVNAKQRTQLEEQRAALQFEEDLREQLDAAKAENKELISFYTTVVEALQQENDTLIREAKEAKEMEAATAALLTTAQMERDYWRQCAIEGEESAAAMASTMQEEIDNLTVENQALKNELQQTREELVAVADETEKAKQELEDMKAAIVAIAVLAIGAAALISLLLDRNGDAVTLPTFDPARVKVVVENERWYPFPFSTWSKKLLPTDRYKYTLVDGFTQCDAPDMMQLAAGEEWVESAWRVECLGSPDGWLYSFDFPSTFYTENFSSACVRRKIHVRGFTASSTFASPAKPPSEMLLGSKLITGGELASPNGRFHFFVQHDGNLVLYDQAQAIWSSKTNGKDAKELVFQTDGNIVLYGANGTPHWHTATHGKKITRFALQDDGNLVAYAVGGKPQWASR
jgi:chromosome segregation ATPase